MKILCFTAALLLTLNAFSQKRDYLVKFTGDTIWGDIKLKNKFFQVTKGDATPVEINADDVKQIKSDDYKGTAVVHCKLQLYTENLEDLERGWTQKSEVDTVMILDEIYTTPKINLYFGTNNFKTRFYFYKTPSDSVPVQLIIRYALQGGLSVYSVDQATYRGEGRRTSINVDKSYVNQLYGIMGNCNKISPTMWEMLTYRDYSLKQVIKRYNKCK
ncbi:MAG TPA: hypothetical protein VHL77_11990 [Ferruginibacter sp.]|jgi:hypothetical protein|nr:hypothetical protein [Ferruginibacter sp.]